MHTPWQKLKQADSRLSLALLAANALLSVAFLALLSLAWSPVGGLQRLGDIGVLWLHANFAIWVILSGTFAFLAGVIGVARGGRQKRSLILTLGHALLVTPYVVGLLWFFNIGGTFADRGVEVRHIAGTDNADYVNPASGPALSVSPDERWVTYWERHTEQEGSRPLPSWQLCSVDLTNGTRTAHSLDSLQTTTPDSKPDWDDVAWGFDPGGWSGSTLFIQGFSLVAAVDPDRESLMPCTRLPAHRAGLDGPSWRIAAGVLSRRHIHTEIYTLERQSLVWTNDGKPRELYDVEHLGNNVDAIMCRDGDQTREVLRKENRYRVYTIHQVRVSPDRTFLAYSASAQGKAYLSIPDNGTTVFIRHMPSGEEKRVGRHSRVSNLIWSADSERLYYAGSGFQRLGTTGVITRSGAGVFCANVEATFPVERYVRVPPPPPDPTPSEMLESATRSWRQYVAPGGDFALRYPNSMDLDDHGDALVLCDRAGQHSDSCSNGSRRPEGFYAQIQIDRRALEDILADLSPEYREGRRRFIPGHRSTQEGIHVGSVRGTRFAGPADCEYTYVLPTETGAFLVISRAARPRTEKEDLVGSIPGLGNSQLPRVEDPTFAYILSSIEFNP